MPEEQTGDAHREKARTGLVVVAQIAVLAAMNAILHALLIVVISVLAVAVMAGGWLLARHVRSLWRRQYIARLPLPDSPPRTQIRSVPVPAIGQRITRRAEVIGRHAIEVSATQGRDSISN